MLDQIEPVRRQDVRRIGSGILRLAARPMSAKVGHDYPEALRRDQGGMAELYPVRIGVRKQPVQQDDGAALTDFMPGKFDTVPGGEAMRCPRLRHRASGGLLQVTASKQFGDLDRVQCRALSQIVRDAPEGKS